MRTCGSASDLARRLAREAEAVCRHYLNNGHREGAYWLVGDVYNTPGRSLYVRLRGPEFGKGAAGKWTDAATSLHGDLIDLIALNQRHASLRVTLEEARLFLRLSKPAQIEDHDREGWRSDRETTAAARRLFSIARPVRGTIAEAYFRERRIDLQRIGVGVKTLRFHSRCHHRDHRRARTQELPALIAAVTNSVGEITGVHRTWLDASGAAKAVVASPRRSMGAILGHGVRFGMTPERGSTPIIAAGEGVETMLSLRMVLPTLPMIAATSANQASLHRARSRCDRPARGGALGRSRTRSRN